jgi:hypothetical protein
VSDHQSRVVLQVASATLDGRRELQESSQRHADQMQERNFKHRWDTMKAAIDQDREKARRTEIMGLTKQLVEKGKDPIEAARIAKEVVDGL